MSALAEALVAAQRRAISALEKAYVAGAFEDDRMRERLDAIGCSDAVDHDHLIHALDVLRAYGGQLPAEAQTNGAQPEPLASEKQRAWIADLFAKSSYTPLDPSDVAKLTRERASKLIDALKAGTYDPAEYDVPF